VTKRKEPNQLLKEGPKTKYLPEVINPKIEEYLKTCGQEQMKLPSVAGLSNYLNISRETIYQWVKIYPELSDTIKKIADRQQEDLMNAGLYGGREVNAGMAVFLLKALHGMKENEPSTLIQVNIKPILGQLDPE
jgi:hypothetical protein